MNAYEHLLDQIDSFIRKYYKNRMIKGLLLFATFSLLLFLFVITLEYFGRFSSTIRFSLFLFFIAVTLGLIGYFVLIPLSKIISFGKRISREQAAKIIGSFFPEISDRLLNTLQLGSFTDLNHPNFELIQASVQQRSKQLGVFNFPSIIDFKGNLKYAKYFAFPFLLLIGLLIFNKSFITDSTERVVSFNKEFEKPKLYDFVLNNLPKELNEGDDLLLDVLIKGDKLPEEVSIVSDLGTYVLNKERKNKFSFAFYKVVKSLNFYLIANNERSETFSVTVVPNAIIGKFNAKIHFPAYLSKSDEFISNAGDLAIPEGSKVEWDVYSKNAKSIQFKFSDSTYSFDSPGFKFRKRFTNSNVLQVQLKNAFTSTDETYNYQVSVIKDAHPTIIVDEQIDTVSASIRFFSGKIADDYGLNSLNFYYEIKSKNGTLRKKSQPVVKPNGTSFSFNYAFDFRSDSLQVEDVLTYYFVVSDNDGVNGSKSTRSQTFTYKLPSLEELQANRNESIDEAKKDIQDLMKQAKDFNKNVEQLKKENLNAKSNSWNNLNKVQQLQQQQQQIQNQLQQLQQQMNESQEQKNSLMEISPELQEKYDLLQQLLEQVMNKEMMDLLKEMEELLKKNNKNQFDQKLNQFDQKSQDLNKQLDRSLELLKKTQVNEMMNDLEKNLSDLSKEQDQLKKDIDNNKLSKEKSLEKQKEINDKFDQLKDDLNKLNELNKDLNRPYDMDKFNELSNEIKEELSKASDNLSKGKNQKAGENQKSASEKMKEMSSGMDLMQNKSNQKQNEEDMSLLRSILKNLMVASIEQESIMLQSNKTSITDPYFTNLAREERKLIDKSKVIIDSLTELAKRQPQTASFIDKEIQQLNLSNKEALKSYNNRDKRSVGIHTQFAMTSYNNLALLLNESLQQMQSQMAAEGNQNGACENPGEGSKGKSGKSGKGNNGDAGESDFKQQLRDQLEKMKNGMKPGQSGKGGQGENGESGENGLPSSELVKMISEQRMLRQQLEQLRQDLNKDGKGTGNALNPLINELDKQEKDLLNKKLGREQINRQQDILTRLLESEKALRERGLDDKRESKSGKSYNLSNQNRIDEYNKQKLHQLELFRSVDPSYTKYYLDKASEYFNRQL